MALDPSIILSGRSPDLVGQFGRGLALGQQQNQIAQQNALAQLYSKQGAGIASGDPRSLNALAAIDPNAAMSAQKAQLGMQADRLGMDSTRLGMDATRQRMDMLTRDEQRQLADQAAKMSAAEKQAAAAQIEEAVRMGMAVQTPQEWDALMTSQGRQDLVGQFGNKQAIAAKYMSMADVIKMAAPAAGPKFRAATADEAARYGASGGQIGENGRFYPINPPSGMSVETGPDGQIRVVQGPGINGGSAKPFTEGQSKDITFAIRAQGALDAFEPVANELANRTNRLLDEVPLGIGRELQGGSYQVAQNAGDEFLQAILRKDTGAAITQDEQELYGNTYLPQPGDGPEKLAAKKQARARAVVALKAGQSPAQIEAIARADAALLAARDQGSPQPNHQADFSQSPEIQDLLKKYPAAGN